MIIKVFISEGFDITDWRLIEIAKSEGKRIYGFEGVCNSRDKSVYMKIGDDKNIIPCYFKNHDLDGYSVFQAESIEGAIKLYEKSYEPKMFDRHTDDVMRTNIQ